MKYLVLLGRILYSWMFIPTAIAHFSAPTIGYAASAGVPAPSILVPLSGIIASLGGLSILLGFKARIGAWLIVLFLVPVTLMMHNWWTVADPAARQMQHIMFHKNLAMLGAALLIIYFGAGPCSIDNMRTKKSDNGPWPESLPKK